MKIEIYARGKRKDCGLWAYGYPIMCNGKAFILPGINSCFFPEPKSLNLNTQPLAFMHWHEVLHETVTFYTGVSDKGKRQIFEGDIVIATLKYFDITNEKCKVIFHNGSFGIQYGFSPDYFKPFDAWDEVEVIGNIYDNPELLME